MQLTCSYNQKLNFGTLSEQLCVSVTLCYSAWECFCVIVELSSGLNFVPWLSMKYCEWSCLMLHMRNYSIWMLFERIWMSNVRQKFDRFWLSVCRVMCFWVLYVLLSSVLLKLLKKKSFSIDPKLSIASTPYECAKNL